MGIEILTHDELPPRFEPQVHAMSSAALWGYADFKVLAKSRRLGIQWAPYLSVYAVEGDKMLSRVGVRRFPMTTKDGVEQVAGITMVATRPDRERKGLARMLLDDVHRRERKDGIRFSTLWTNKSWYAHTLYERLGYFDVYEWHRAMRRIPARVPQLPRGWRLRPATRRDGFAMCGLHDRATRGRPGFAPRQRGFWSKRFAWGRNDPKEFRILTNGGRTAGYAEFSGPPGRRASGEIVAVGAEARDNLLLGIEREASGGWLMVIGGFVNETGAELSGRGYDVLPGAWFPLMAADLQGKMGRDELVAHLGADDPRFSCQNSDWF